ncbi:MAG: glycosyl-4,4'-diaponeurosporenoate acyltransferase [Chitinivibrionales bacterium]|nr:glycosyl-4,4'-diaponeurosporenoate acyltransferase [Chitinivibrionales bacterium]
MERTRRFRTRKAKGSPGPGVARTIVLDSAAWFVLHMLIAFGATLLPRNLFNERQWLFRIRGWERGGTLYERLNVMAWKKLLPDGAALFRGGFRKKHMQAGNKTYLMQFVKETCRAEAAHWTVIAVSPLFFLWNPRRVGVVMIAYALAANLPCVIVQRYNRPRLMRIAQRMGKAGARSPVERARSTEARATHMSEQHRQGTSASEIVS